VCSILSPSLAVPLAPGVPVIVSPAGMSGGMVRGWVHEVMRDGSIVVVTAARPGEIPEVLAVDLTSDASWVLLDVSEAQGYLHALGLVVARVGAVWPLLGLETSLFRLGLLGPLSRLTAAEAWTALQARALTGRTNGLDRQRLVAALADLALRGHPV